MDPCYQDPQSQLVEAATSKDLRKFRQALLSGADPDHQVDTNGVSLFEWLCGQGESANFISECIKHGAQLNRQNATLEKYPIHFACESLDVGNVDAVANAMVHQGIDLSVKYYGQTPLTQVAGKINKDNVAKCCEIVKVLIKNGADVNVPDPKDQTPILLLLKKLTAGDEVRGAVKFLLHNCVVDLDSYRDGEARKRLREKCSDLESLVRDGKDVSVPLLQSHLKNRRELAFIKDLETVLVQKGNINELVTGGATLLETAVEENLTLATKELIARGANVNKFNHGTMSPVKVAALRGNVEILETLLKVPEVVISDSDRTPVLCTVIKRLSEGSEKDRERYRECFKLLINHAEIDVNETDTTDSTALHFACRYRNRDAVVALLEKSAYIGMQNCLNSIAIDDIEPEILERHFDNCIRTNHSRIGDDDFEIELDFSNFSPISSGGKTIKYSEEMAPLMVIAKTKELKHLMTHPLITSFLFIKWHRLFSLFLLNLILYSVFCVSLVTYVVFFYGGSEYRSVEAIFVFLIVIGGVFIIIREVSQLVLSPVKYVKLPENYLEIALIIMTIVVLITNYEEEYTTRTRMIASITILLAATELSLLISSLPNAFISTHLVMLKRVSSSFMKSLSINSVIILAFAFCFYTLFNGAPPDDSGDGESKFNRFVDPGTAIIKTIVMLTGEFEAASINFDVNQSSYFIFLMFVFFMSIVLFNLLNGLAVSDTAIIKAQAEQCHFIEKAATLNRFEKSVLSKDFSFLPGVKENNLLRTWVCNIICVFPHFLPQKKIVIYPNAGNRIKVPIQRPATADYNGTDTSVLIDGTTEKRDLAATSKICLCQPCLGHCSALDRKIVKQLMHCIDRRRVAEEEDQEKDFLKQKIISIETKLSRMESVFGELLAQMQKN